MNQWADLDETWQDGSPNHPESTFTINFDLAGFPGV